MALALDDTKAVILRSDDTVAVAARPIPRGFSLQLGGRTIEVREPIGLDLARTGNAPPNPLCGSRERPTGLSKSG